MQDVLKKTKLNWSIV